MIAMPQRPVAVPTPARRGVSLGLSLAGAALLFALLILGLNVRTVVRSVTPPTYVEMLPTPADPPPVVPVSAPVPQQAARQASPASVAPRPPEAVDVTRTVAPVPAPLPPTTPADMFPDVSKPGEGSAGTGTAPGAGGAGSGTGASGMQAASWVVEPGDRELWPYFPRAALQAKLSGSTVLRCLLAWNKHVRLCRVVSESPAGYGFGEAGLRASPNFRINPPRVGGEMVRKSWIEIRLGFNLR